MKPGGPGQRGAGKQTFKGSRLPTIPMEWMDPMSWRLPSGKALAEFALQAGFLAPLMLSGPQLKRRKKVEPVPLPVTTEKSVVRGQVGEEPEHSGTFRDTR